MKMEVSAPSSPRWVWMAAIWSGIALFDATQTVVVMRAAGMHHAWVRLFLTESLGWLPWMLATPLIMHAGARYPLAFARLRAAPNWGRHVVVWLVVNHAADAWMAGLEHVLNPWTPDAAPAPFADLLRATVQNHWVSSIILYYCVLMAGAVLDSRERLAHQRTASAQLAEQLAKAQLDALRHQVEPHFLFNALNAVSGLVRDGQNDRAVETIARVSEFLRHVLHDAGHQEATLAEELRFATMYLDIQKVRFGERLHVGIDMAPELGRAIVPRLILQPIVENAVKHGIGMRVQPGAIEIAANRTGDRLVVTVRNDGPPLRAGSDPASLNGTAAAAPDDAAPGASIGLANVRQRLAGLYGDAARLAMADVDQRGVRVTISLPFHEVPWRR